jgi:uncharacterized glyoxalase superfamily protein PhnB
VVRFDAFGLVVDDMAATLAFYRRLGLDIPEGSEGEGHVEVEVGGMRMMFDTVEVVRSFSEWEPPSGGHRIGLAFLCESPDAVDSTYAELTGAGYRGRLEPFDAFWGQRYATVLDPDGSPVDLFAPVE